MELKKIASLCDLALPLPVRIAGKEQKTALKVFIHLSLLCGYDLPALGRFLGRHHSTIIHHRSCNPLSTVRREVERLFDSHPELKILLEKKKTLCPMIDDVNPQTFPGPAAERIAAERRRISRLLAQPEAGADFVFQPLDKDGFLAEFVFQALKKAFKGEPLKFESGLFLIEVGDPENGCFPVKIKNKPQLYGWICPLPGTD